MGEKLHLREDEIVLVHNSHRMLLGATPRSLRMRKDTVEMIGLFLLNRHPGILLTICSFLRRLAETELGSRRRPQYSTGISTSREHGACRTRRHAC